jgi:hypothetical protein
MSKTVGATVRPVANDVPVTPMLMNPVDAYRHPPPARGEPCNWYCHLALTAGLQHGPADLLQETGAGRPAAPAAAPAGGTATTASRSKPIDTKSVVRSLIVVPPVRDSPGSRVLTGDWPVS